MKNHPTTIFLTLTIGIMGITGIAYGQDDRLPDMDPGVKENRMETPGELMPEGGDIKTIKPAPIARDTVQTKPAARKPENKSKSEESVLSFNFLYYLIERFKLADIVD